jgi:peroxiredoxin
MYVLWYLLLFIFFPFVCYSQGLGKGDTFPTFELKDGLSRKDYTYLELSPGSLFSRGKTNLNDIKAHLLFVEFLNKYCIACQKDAPEFARFFKEIERAPDLRGKVKIFGIAIGNSVKEVENFRKDYDIGFPVVSDSDTAIFRKIGSPGGSPLVYVLKKDDPRWVIVDGFKGEATYADLLMRVRVDMALDVKNLKKGSLWTEEPVRKPSEKEVRKALFGRMPGLRIVRTIAFENGDLLVVRKGKETLFAKTEARKIICSVCHDASFIYVFDRKGIIRDFIPIVVTKTDNLPFSVDDTERMRKNLVGRSLFMPFKFDKEVDAVTSATLTSLVIYDSVYHGRELLNLVEREK